MFQNVDHILREAPLGPNSQPRLGSETRPPPSTPPDRFQSPAKLALVEGFNTLEHKEVFMHSMTNYAHGDVVDVNWYNHV